ncbi:MAG: hypothetical protein HQK95_06855 [Nitrospirae bacterium]|nr:hypothetical protein [Nitrospirota bacterium]
MTISGLLKGRSAVNAFFILSIVSAAFFGAIAALSNGFVWDDMHMVTNPVLVDSNSFYGYFFGKSLYFRPFLRLSLSLDWGLWRMSPMGYHLHNLIIHAANSVLVFVVAGCLMAKDDGDMLPAFLAGLAFALHPVHSEAIAWISGRTDLLATFFFLLAFLGFLIYRWEDNPRGIVICAVFYLFSMFSKENGITLIAVVVAYGLLTKMPWRRLVLSAGILLAVVVVYFVMRQGSGLSDVIKRPGTQGAYLSPLISMINFLYDLVYGSGYYIEKLLLPLNLNLLPAIPGGGGFLGLFLSGGGGFLFWFNRCWPFIAFSIFLIGLTIPPFLFNIISQVTGTFGWAHL